MTASDRTVSVTLKAKISGYVSALQAAGRETAVFAGKLDEASKADKLSKVSEGATIAGASLVGLAAAAIKSAADFDSAMSRVEAATHASSSQMASLRAAAIQAGADTVFSATEAASAEEELAKAGVSVTDIVNGGLRGALNLASAGELSVAEAASVAATAMTQFHLAGSQVPHIADLLAAAAGKAQGDVHDMGYALNQSGLVASQFGLSIEATTGTLAAFASAGLLGSDAGTSFKTMLLALANPSTQATATMKQLGISAYDAQGNFVGIAKFAGILHDKLSGLTQQQRQSALATIFGSDAIRAATVLYNNGSKGITSWENKVNDAGYAADTAAKKLDNLSGDLEQLRGSLETALIKSGSGANSVLRALAESATQSVNSFSALPSSVTGAATVLAGLVGSVLLGAGAFGSIAPKIRETQKELEALGPTGAKASKLLGGLSKVGAYGTAAAVGVEILAAGANTLADHIDKALPSVGDLTRSMQELGTTGRVTGAAVTVLGANFDTLRSDLDNSSGAMAKADSGVKTLFGTIGVKSLTAAQLLSTPFLSVLRPADEATARIQATDKALAELVNSGHADEAQKALSQMADESGLSMTELLKKYPQLQAALKSSAASASTTGSSMSDLTNSMHGNALAAQAAADAVQNYSDTLHALNDDSLSARKTADEYQQSLIDLKKQLDSGGSSFRGNSQDALNNRSALYRAVDAILAAYDAEAKLKPGTDAAASALDRMRNSLINTLTPYFNSRAAAQRFVDTVLKIPASKATHVSAPGAASAKKQVDSLINSVNSLRSKTIRINVEEFVHPHGNAKGGSGNDLNGILGGGNPNSRWGGIRHFDVGGIYQATPGGLYRFAEQGTGDEALVPRNGDTGRSRSILDTAAAWYGGTVAWGRAQPAAAGAAPVGAGSPSFDVRVFVGDQEIRDMVRVEVSENNRSTRRSATQGRRP